jgi:hypothetical protein
MQAMPDEVIKVSNGIMRFEGPGRYAMDVDLDDEPMKTLIATMVARKITNDPTMVAFEGMAISRLHTPRFPAPCRLRPNAVSVREALRCQRT